MKILTSPVLRRRPFSGDLLTAGNINRCFSTSSFDCPERKIIRMSDLGGGRLIRGKSARELCKEMREEFKRKKEAEREEKKRRRGELIDKNTFLNISRNAGLDGQGSARTPPTSNRKRPSSSRDSQQTRAGESSEEVREVQPTPKRPRVHSSPSVQELPLVEGPKLMQEVATEAMGGFIGTPRPLEFPSSSTIPSLSKMTQAAKEKHAKEIAESWVPPADLEEMLKSTHSLYPKAVASMMETWGIVYTLDKAIKSSDEKAGKMKTAYRKMKQAHEELKEKHASMKLDYEELKGKHASLEHTAKNHKEMLEHISVQCREAMLELSAEKAENAELKARVAKLEEENRELAEKADAELKNSATEMAQLIEDVEAGVRATHQQMYGSVRDVEKFVDYINKLLDKELVIKDGKIITEEEAALFGDAPEDIGQEEAVGDAGHEEEPADKAPEDAPEAPNPNQPEASPDDEEITDI